MRFRLIEQTKHDYQIGDIVFLNRDKVSGDLTKKLIQQKHMFVVSNVKDNTIRVNTVTSNMKLLNRYPSYIPKEQTPFKKESRIVLSSQGYVSKDAVYKVIGHLSENDAKGLFDAVKNNNYINQIIENTIRK